MASRFNIQTAGTADFSKIKIDGIKTNKYGGRSARINYDGGRFLLQTPRMRLPYGIGVYEEKDAEGRVTKTRYSLDFSFGGYKADERNSEKPLVKRFYEWMDKFETYVKDQAKKNSYTWWENPMRRKQPSVLSSALSSSITATRLRERLPASILLL